MYRKNRLPNYGVFDEVRYFEPGSEAALATVDGVAVGLTICEDLWQPGAPASLEAERGARLILNPSGSPYLRGKGRDRELMFAERARATTVPCASTIKLWPSKTSSSCPPTRLQNAIGTPYARARSANISSRS